MIKILSMPANTYCHIVIILILSVSTVSANIRLIETLDETKDKAKEGNLDAQYLLGNIYRAGVGLPQNYQEAMKWLQNAAEQGHVHAKYALGEMYYKGEGSEVDYDMALYWYKEAAKSNYDDAQYELGKMYYEGKGIDQNYLKAHKWANLASAQGHEEAADLRDTIANQMSPTEITEAQHYAHEFAAEHAERKRQEAERKRKEAAEAERIRREEAERKRKEAEEAEQKRLAEEERRRKEDKERRRKEEERKRQEEAMRQRRDEEERKREAGQAGHHTRIILRQIESNFNIQGLPSGLSASLAMQLAANGDVIDVAISRSSGNSLFDQRALIAVQRSSPLRVPQDREQFERLGFRQFTVRFEPKSPEIALDVEPTVRIQPQYPSSALRAGIEGSVTVDFTIDTDGSVKDPEIVDADPPRIFDDVVLRAIRRWKFEPEIVDGVAIEKRAREVIHFRLQR